MKIPFNKPLATGKELDYIRQAIENRHLSGNGAFTKNCQQWLKKHLNAAGVLLTHSCTAALEMAAMLTNIQPGDEVIMPSYTFVSTANAFVLRGGVPVFVDIRPDTLNMDENKIEAAITPKTKAIVPVHYAGVGCEMDAIMAIAEKHSLLVIEDAAQGLMTKYNNKPLGSLGHMAAFSFHETKNIISGEGGALILNDERLTERAEILWEKGTNRSQFFRGQIDKYTWMDIGSSYLPSEIVAAYLWAQMETAEGITQQRLAIWQLYKEALTPLAQKGHITLPKVPKHCTPNAHMFYLLSDSLQTRTELIARLNETGINSVFHYIPLHSSPAGKKYGTTSGNLTITNQVSDTLLRLPLWVGMTSDDVDRICDALHQFYQNRPVARPAHSIPS